MATLTETAYWTRKFVKYGAIFLVVFFFLRIIFQIGRDLWVEYNPPPPPPPTVSFGKLPQINFPTPSAEQSIPKLSYKLETIQGGLPRLPSIGKVYFTPNRGPNLLGLERATAQAQKMGFKGEPEEMGRALFRWTSQNTPVSTLEIDINSGSFHLLYDYKNDQELLSNKNLPSNQPAASEAKNFLGNNNLLAADLETGTAEFDYLRFSYPDIVQVPSLSEADFIRVNLFRANLDELRILPPNPKRSLISFLFSGSRTLDKRIVEIDYYYIPIEKEIFATYPLKPINQAWTEMQSGSGYIANLGENKDGQITIRKIYHAYFESPEAQHYLQPIYVFEGDRNFFGYVTAIDPKWTE